MELTTNEIITNVLRHGGLILWAESEGMEIAELEAAIARWRQEASNHMRRRAQHELGEAGIDARLVERITGYTTPSDPHYAPPVSQREAAADAAHIKKWGYV